jgi:hypothetical protein
VGSHLEGSADKGDIATTQTETAKSLLKYLRVVGSRAHGRLLGVGIVANTVCTVHVHHDGWLGRDMKFHSRAIRWTSLFDPSFIQELDSMLLFCKNDRPNDDMEERQFSAFAELTVAEDEEDEDENEEGEAKAEAEAEVVGTQNDYGHDVSDPMEVDDENYENL